MKNQVRLRRFIGDSTRLDERCGGDEPAILRYGANIGTVSRHVFDAVTGAPTPLVPGYSATPPRKFRDRSAEVRAAPGA